MIRIGVSALIFTATSTQFALSSEAQRLVDLYGNLQTREWITSVPGSARAEISEALGSELSDRYVLNTCMRGMARDPEASNKPIRESIMNCIEWGKKNGW